MMKARHTLTATITVLGIIFVLAAADATLVERDWLSTAWLATEEPEPEPEEPTPVIGVRKTDGADVRETLVQQGLKFQDSDERTLIGQIIPESDATVNTLLILKNSDRTGLIAWVDAPNVQRYFLALKEALHASFSPEVTDLIDETQQRDGQPSRSILSFRDPKLSEERIVFLRIRQRLVELHVADGKDDIIFDLVEELSK